MDKQQLTNQLEALEQRCAEHEVKLQDCQQVCTVHSVQAKQPTLLLLACLPPGPIAFIRLSHCIGVTAQMCDLLLLIACLLAAPYR